MTQEHGPGSRSDAQRHTENQGRADAEQAEHGQPVDGRVADDAVEHTVQRASANPGREALGGRTAVDPRTRASGWRIPTRTIFCSFGRADPEVGFSGACSHLSLRETSTAGGRYLEGVFPRRHR